MKSYECAVIISPDAGENASEGAKQKYSDIITTGGGEIAKIDDWGKRRLAYEIKKHEEGVYLIFYFRADYKTLVELDRNLRLDENILRHMIVRVQSTSSAGLEPGKADTTEVAKQEEELG